MSPSQIIRFRITSNRLAVVLLSLLMSVMFSCSFVPRQEQFVTAAMSPMYTRSAGECDDAEGRAATLKAITGLNPDHISVFDWNIYKSRKPGLIEDLVHLSSEADIVLLQEVSFNTPLRDVLQNSQPFWDFNSAFTYKGVETGVLIASVIEPLTRCGMRQTEPVIGLPKTAVITSYRIAGSSKKLVVANVHAINFTLGTQSYKEQFEEIREALRGHDGPLILAGDFNNWNDRRAEIIESLAAELNLSTLGFSDGARTTFWGKAVDHILYRGLEPVTRTAYQVESSDHNPISVVFRFTGEQNLAIIPHEN